MCIKEEIMYVNEQAFSKALCARLKKEGFMVQRMETHGTGVGVPDIYAVGYGFGIWLELKVHETNSIFMDKVKVPWRPGQQAWHLDYRSHMLCKRCGLTLMSCKDGIIVVPMNQVYDKNTVIKPQGMNYKQWKDVSLVRFLNVMSTSVPCVRTLNKYDRIMSLVYWIDSYWPDELDYDADVLLDEYSIKSNSDFENNKLNLFLELEEYCKLQNL